MKIKLTKIETPKEAEYDSLIEIGKPYIGEFIKIPCVGECFYMKNEGIDSHFRTSIVKEIIDENTFRTNNSIYKFEEIE